MQVRALVQTFADNMLRQPGDVFEFTGELGDGLEEANPKTNKAARAAQLAEQQAARDKAEALRRQADKAKAELEANPGDSGKAAAAMQADQVARDAEDAAGIEHDLV